MWITMSPRCWTFGRTNKVRSRAAILYYSVAPPVASLRGISPDETGFLFSLVRVNRPWIVGVTDYGHPGTIAGSDCGGHRAAAQRKRGAVGAQSCAEGLHQQRLEAR